MQMDETLEEDTHPHNARVVTDVDITTNVEM
jgi:hypothetical protein